MLYCDRLFCPRRTGDLDFYCLFEAIIRAAFSVPVEERSAADMTEFFTESDEAFTSVVLYWYVGFIGHNNISTAKTKTLTQL